MYLLKKIDSFVLKKYFLLFLGCFCICLFVCVMQFFWRFSDVIMGKGLGGDVLAQFFWYVSLSLVPMALPLAILLTSLITFGNMGEQLELTAFKAAGVPLLRIMRSLIISSILLTGVSFCFQNYIGPHAQNQLTSMILMMKETSPAIEIPEGVFYNGIPQVNLYVERKDVSTGMLYTVKIYRVDMGIEKAQIVVADSARLEVTADKHYLLLTMFNGEQYQNLDAGNSSSSNGVNQPYDRETFQEKALLIDYDTEPADADASRTSSMADSKNLADLEKGIDSLNNVFDSIGRGYYENVKIRYMSTGLLSKKDSLLAQKKSEKVVLDSVMAHMSQGERMNLYRKAKNTVQDVNTELENVYQFSKDGYRQVRKHEIKWHEKFSSSLACLLFFFIGAPLGSIIRKGGLGSSIFISVLIFVIYYIISTGTMKTAREGNMYVSLAMWMSVIVMTPIAYLLTSKSNKDKMTFNKDVFINLYNTLICKRKKRSLITKEISIIEPHYQWAVEQIAELSDMGKKIKKNLRLSHLPSYINMFFKPKAADDVSTMAGNLEDLIKDLSNSEDSGVVVLLNEYPIVNTSAHDLPIHNKWIRLAMGIVVPVGLFFWFRAIRFRRQLKNDINSIAKTNKKVLYWFGKRGYAMVEDYGELDEAETGEENETQE